MARIVGIVKKLNIAAKGARNKKETCYTGFRLDQSEEQRNSPRNATVVEVLRPKQMRPAIRESIPMTQTTPSVNFSF